jgi:hypothetical protein
MPHACIEISTAVSSRQPCPQFGVQPHGLCAAYMQPCASPATGKSGSLVLEQCNPLWLLFFGISTGQRAIRLRVHTELSLYVRSIHRAERLRWLSLLSKGESGKNTCPSTAFDQALQMAARMGDEAGPPPQSLDLRYVGSAQQQTSTPQQFLQFSRLTVELRLKIWAEAAYVEFERLKAFTSHVPRLLSVDILQTTAPRKGRLHVLRNTAYQLLILNSISRVSQEARAEVSRLLQMQDLIPALDYLSRRTATPKMIDMERTRCFQIGPHEVSARKESISQPPFGKNVTRLAVSIGMAHLPPQAKQFGPWDRFCGTEDFLTRSAHLFGNEIETLYFYDANTFGGLLRRSGLSGSLRARHGTFDDLVRIGAEDWFLVPHLRTGPGYFFGDVGRCLLGIPSGPVTSPDTVNGSESGSFTAAAAARFVIPPHHAIYRMRIMVQYGEAFRLCHERPPAFVEGMWTAMRQRGIRLPMETLTLLEEMLRMARNGALPKLAQISMLVPIYDWDLLPEGLAPAEDVQVDEKPFGARYWTDETY